MDKFIRENNVISTMFIAVLLVMVWVLLPSCNKEGYPVGFRTIVLKGEKFLTFTNDEYNNYITTRKLEPDDIPQNYRVHKYNNWHEEVDIIVIQETR